MKIWAILPAAGIGRRMGSITPKQYLPINGVPVISIALKKLASVDAIDGIIVVIHPEDSHWSKLDIDLGSKITTTAGGEERHISVLNGLMAIAGQAEAEDWVLVHDAVRPCVLVADIEKLLSELADSPVGGLLGAPVEHTMKRVGENQAVIETLDRSEIWNAYTPQMFRYGLLLQAMQSAQADSIGITDEASAIEALGHAVTMVQGAKTNIKITEESDLALAQTILQQQGFTP